MNFKTDVSRLKTQTAFSKFSSLKSVFENLHFRDGLVWTVGITQEIKLRLSFWRSVDAAIITDGLQAYISKFPSHS